MINKNYELRGGLYMETAAVANNLANSGITAPHNNLPYSEALLLGISGGLGAGYSLQETDDYPYKSLNLSFFNGWQNRTQKLFQLFERISIPVNMFKTGIKEQAEITLADTLKEGKTPLCWIDHTCLPYFNSPKISKKWGFFVNAIGIDQEKKQIWIDDRSSLPLLIGLEDFELARRASGRLRHQMITLSPPSRKINIYQAVREGLQDCVDNLSHSSENRSLMVFKRWADLTHNNKSKKSWEKIFSDTRGLGLTLQTIYESTTPSGLYGGSLRGLYSRFLEEAVHILNLSRLKDAAARYCLLEKRWQEFGSAALPDEVPQFVEIKELIQLQNKLFRTKGNADLSRILKTRSRLQQIQEEINEDFPLNPQQTNELFAELQQRLLKIYSEELGALDSIKRILV